MDEGQVKWHPELLSRRKIRATDFNGFANDINEIVGIGAGDSGYGQNQLVIPSSSFRY